MIEDNYLTEEEVRDLIDSLIESSEYKIYVDVDFEMNKLEDELWETNKKVNRINERVLELESELRDFERFEYEDLIEFMNEFDDWEDTIVFLTKSEYDDLLQRIEILEGEPIVYTGCNMVSLLWEFGEAIDDGYTLDLVNGNLVEYKNGIATGDIFTNQDLIDYYCTTGE